MPSYIPVFLRLVPLGFFPGICAYTIRFHLAGPLVV